MMVIMISNVIFEEKKLNNSYKTQDIRVIILISSLILVTRSFSMMKNIKVLRDFSIMNFCK
jgi:hypothetical protein